MARDIKPTHDQIAQRAYQIFVERGRPEGHDMDHWLEAEIQLSSSQPQPGKSNQIHKMQPAMERRAQFRS